MRWLASTIACGVAAVSSRLLRASATVADIRQVDSPFPIRAHPLRLSPTLIDASANTSNGDTPFPTGAWWTNLVLEKGDTPVATMPYSFAIKSGKLHASYPFRVVLPTVIQNGFLSEIVASAVSPTPWQQRVVDFDPLSVTVKFTTDATDDTNSGDFTAHLVRGSPYITLTYSGSTPLIESMDGIKIQRLKRLDDTMTDMAGKPLTMGLYAVQVSNNHVWYVFVSDPSITLQLNHGKITGDAPLNGVLRIALGVSVDTLLSLIESAAVYPVGGQVTYNVDVAKDTAVVAFQWKTKYFPSVENASVKPKLLMLALPHHNDTFVDGSVTILDEVRYTAIRGLMVGVLGDTWSMKEDLPDIEWNYASKEGVFGPTAPEYDGRRSQRAAEATKLIVESLKQDIQKYPDLSPDSYNFGKLIARDARLLLVADAFQEQVAFDHQLDKLKHHLGKWLTATNDDVLVYDERFGGLVTTDGLNDVAADYGNGWYNDHHFHYGYIVNALAVVRKYDPAFIAAHSTAVAMIAADIGTTLDGTSTKFLSDFPARDYFPTARHKDWFVGHSYASGLFIMNVGKSQESSSECINAYYGLALLASLEANADTDAQSYYHYARVLLALELRATKKYWHMRENSQVYEPVFARNAMVGVVGEMSVTYSTWFGSNPEYVHGINMIPFTPITSQLMNEAYVAREYDQLRSSYAALDANDIWKSIIVMDHAILDGEAAWIELTTEVNAFDTWNSKTNALFWIATRPSWFDQRDRKKLTTPNFHDEDKCFGFPACSTAGANGTALSCCDSLPGCCPSSLGCCPQKDPAKTPINACFGEHQCGILGLGCCNTIDGCCEPNPVTGTVLGCCKDQTPRKVTTAPPALVSSSNSSGYCLKQPKCDSLGLLCCDSVEGCCQPDRVSGATLDCCVPESANDDAATCHQQPMCAAAKLDCCALPNGCCTPDPVSGGVLDCCVATTPTPTTTAPPPTESDTCKDEPECAKAGLDCCLSPQGCCTPDPVTGDTLLCCKNHKTRDQVTTGTGDSAAQDEDESSMTTRIVVGTIVVVVLGAVVVGAVTLYRRRHYAPVGGNDMDMRTWVCGALVVVVAAFFVYLVAVA